MAGSEGGYEEERGEDKEMISSSSELTRLKAYASAASARALPNASLEATTDPISI